MAAAHNGATATVGVVTPSASLENVATLLPPAAAHDHWLPPLAPPPVPTLTSPLSQSLLSQSQSLHVPGSPALVASGTQPAPQALPQRPGTPQVPLPPPLARLPPLARALSNVSGAGTPPLHVSTTGPAPPPALALALDSSTAVLVGTGANTAQTPVRAALQRMRAQGRGLAVVTAASSAKAGLASVAAGLSGAERGTASAGLEPTPSPFLVTPPPVSANAHRQNAHHSDYSERNGSGSNDDAAVNAAMGGLGATATRIRESANPQRDVGADAFSVITLTLTPSSQSRSQTQAQQPILTQVQAKESGHARPHQSL